MSEPVSEEDLLTSFDTRAGDEDQAEPDFDTTVAHPARVWDFLLGGKDNFPVDKATAEQALAVAPELRVMAREYRAFLRRAVRFLAGEARVRQFLDIGTGLPTQGNVHEVAREVDPDARVVYADADRLQPAVASSAAGNTRERPRGAGH